MLESLTPDTQATLLLVGQFSESPKAKPLTILEYNRLAKQLHELGLRPGDIVREMPKALIADTTRLKVLLSRGTSLALAVERWTRLGIRVIGRGEEVYPKFLKTKLRGAAAPILYFAGNAELLKSEGLCVVGSRNVSEAGLEFAAELGRRCASEGLTVISGDARGADRAAMDGAHDMCGNVTAILVDALTKAVLSKRNREAILSGRLALLTPYDPDAGFAVSKAMDRNKYMYALASAAVIIDSDTKGGTWSGAVENEKHRWTPAFVRVSDDAPAGNHRLANLGLRPIGTQHLSQDLRSLLLTSRAGLSSQPDLLDENDTVPVVKGGERKSLYAHFIDEITIWLAQGPQSDVTIANRFELERAQSKRWLERAFEEGVLKKLKKPTRFALRDNDASSDEVDRHNTNSPLLL